MLDERESDGPNELPEVDKPASSEDFLGSEESDGSEEPEDSEEADGSDDSAGPLPGVSGTSVSGPFSSTISMSVSCVTSTVDGVAEASELKGPTTLTAPNAKETTDAAAIHLRVVGRTP